MNIRISDDLQEKIATKWKTSGTDQSSTPCNSVLRFAILLVGVSVVTLMLGLTVAAYMSGKAPDMFPPEVMQLLG